MRLVVATLLLTLPLLVTAGQTDKAAKVEAALQKRFTAADKDGNGQLTREEAEAGMPRLAKVFDQIDTDGKGYLTEDQVKSYMASEFASRKGQRDGQ